MGGRPCRADCRGETDKMKGARIIVLCVAVGAGGVAALLARHSHEPPPAPAPAPRAEIETVEVLVAKDDIAIGQPLSAQNLAWQTWPAAAAGPQFIRKA